MMTDTDLEILEAYLDDALSDQELAQVALRLSREPELAAELDALRADRALRKQVWSSLEPGDAEVEHLLGRVDEAVRRRAWWERQTRWGKWVGAAAACLLFGFTTGWLGRGPAAPVPNVQTGSSIGGASTSTSAAPQRQYQVVITDEAGRTAVQRFSSYDKAREFAEDLKNWQEKQRQMQTGNVVPTGGKF